jgi:hypothetical protein
MSEDTDLLREIRDLLRLVAAPALAEREQKQKARLLEIVGRSKRKADAVLLMDGTRSQATISKECGIDMGDLSRLVRALRESQLIAPDDNPRILLAVPADFMTSFASEVHE